MAEKKPSGFRFRLPWLLQPAQSPAREPPTQPPRATTQTSAASTPAPAQRPPFRPPGKALAPPTPAPAAAPPTVATPIPFSPRRSPPQSATSPPPPSISPKSSVTKSPTDKTIEPVATQPTKETQATTETPVPTTPPQTPPFSPPRQAQSQPSPPQTPPPPSSVSPKKSVPKSPIAKTTKPVAPQPAKETQTITETIPTKETQTITETIPTKETAGPATPPLSPPLSPHTKAQPQPSPPQITPLPSPSVSPKSSVPKSPIAKNTEPIAAQPDKETQTATNTTPTIETTGPATPLMQAQSQPSPPQTPPPAKQSQTRTPPRSPSPLTSEPADKTPSLPSHPIKTTTEGSEIKRSTDITGEKLPVESNLIPQGNHLAVDEKPREITQVRGTQTTSMDSNAPDLKSQKPKLTTTTRVPLHKEIKDNISRFIHKTATSSMKQPMDEKPASVITIAGDNTGASMHLSSDEIKRGHKLTTDTPANDSAINGDKSEHKEATAIVNSNVQGINNSIMFNSSVSERNPGVHLGFYHNQANDSMMKKTESFEMQRAEVNITPPQKVVYEFGIPPEGAYMEPSEWEIDEDEPEASGTGCEIEVS